MIATIRPTLNRTAAGRFISLAFGILLVAGCSPDTPSGPSAPTLAVARESGSLTLRLRNVLREASFTGRVGLTLEAQLGRPIDRNLA